VTAPPVPQLLNNHRRPMPSVQFQPAYNPPARSLACVRACHLPPMRTTKHGECRLAVCFQRVPVHQTSAVLDVVNTSTPSCSGVCISAPPMHMCACIADHFLRLQRRHWRREQRCVMRRTKPSSSERKTPSCTRDSTWSVLAAVCHA
jgi:hypothetical protein